MHLLITLNTIDQSLDDTKSFFVTWSTLNSTDVPNIGGSWVEYGTNPRNLNQISFDRETKFTDGGNQHSVQYIHRSILSPLAPAMVYCKYKNSQKQIFVIRQ